MPSVSQTAQRFGAHMSVAGGLAYAFEAAQAAGCDCLQIFVKNQRQWRAKPLADSDVRSFRAAARRTGIKPVVAHASYLVNLASADQALAARSCAALVDELTRCESLGVPFLVFHPGAFKDSSLEAGMARIVRGIDRIHRQTAGYRSRLLLETTAGQGTSIGHRFEQLAWILRRVDQAGRLGVCVDTCHIFAAGYPLRRLQDYDATISHLIKTVGVRRIKCIHVNDSKGGLGSRVDRHDHIGAGCIGNAGFKNLVNDHRLQRVPKILETPKGTNERGQDLDVINLKKLRRFIRKQ